MRRINVLHINADLLVAGAQRVALNLITHLDKSQYDSSICALKGGPLVEVAKKMNYEVKIMNPKILFDIRVLFQLVALLRRKKIDIIHSHQLHANFYAALAAKLAKVPVCIVCEHGRYLFEKKGRIIANKILVLLSTIMVSVSEDLKKQLISIGGISEHRIKIIYNGIDIDKFKPVYNKIQKRKELGFLQECPIVGILANLVPVKGHIYFLKAVARVIEHIPEVKVLLIGDGILKTKLKNLCKELNIEQSVFFLGQRQDIPELLNILDVFVLSSLSEEISLALLEAMAMERPVVATKVGGNPEVIADGVNGLLVPPRDADALAQAIVKLLQNKDFALKLGQTARRKIKTNFSLNIMVEETENLYEKLFKRKVKRLPL